MRGVMDEIISQITGNETGKQRVCPLSCSNHIEDKIEKSVKECSQRDTDWKRHHQAGLALGLGVVDTVKQKADPFLHGGVRFEMKNKAVHCVFGKCPDKKPQ